MVRRVESEKNKADSGERLRLFASHHVFSRRSCRDSTMAVEIGGKQQLRFQRRERGDRSWGFEERECFWSCSVREDSFHFNAEFDFWGNWRHPLLRSNFRLNLKKEIHVKRGCWAVSHVHYESSFHIDQAHGDEWAVGPRLPSSRSWAGLLAQFE